MATLSATQLDQLVVSVGITDPTVRAIAVAIALAESGGNPAATHRNSDKYRSIDYGLWQINGHWHPTYDTRLLLTASYNASAMAAISSNGTNWGPWATYANGNYRKHLDAAQAAVKANSGAQGATAGAQAATGGWIDTVTGLVGGVLNPGGVVTDVAGGAADAVTGGLFGNLFKTWQRDIFGLVIAGVFVTAALALIALGLSKLSGLDASKVMATAGTAAQAAALV